MNDDALAKRRFAVINLVRLGGLLMVLAGIAAQQGVLPLPDPIGLILVVLGLIEFFALPNVLARRWRTKD